MCAEGLKAMGVGGGEERLAVDGGDMAGAAIEIEEALVEMADLDRIEAIDFLEQTFPDRCTEDEKWVRRETKKRFPAASAELAQVGESTEMFDFVRLDIQEHYVRAF
jgi:hypothetical protein